VVHWLLVLQHFFAIYSLSLMKESKGFSGGRYEKINIDEGMLVFGFDFFLFAW